MVAGGLLPSWLPIPTCETGNRNAVERVFREIKHRTNQLQNSFSHPEVTTAKIGRKRLPSHVISLSEHGSLSTDNLFILPCIRPDMDNIVLITVDCLRARNVGAYGYDRDTTPKIDDLSRNGIKFNNCYSNAPYTSTSFPSILGSIYHTMYNGIQLPQSVPLIPEVLSDYGYETAGFVSANPNLIPEIGYDRGFDTYIDFISNPSKNETTTTSTQSVSSVESEYSTSHIDGAIERLLSGVEENDTLRPYAKRLYMLCYYRMLEPIRKTRNYVRFLRGHTPNALSRHTSQPANQVIGRAIKWFESNHKSSKPFFLWVHLMDCHSWYDPAPEHVEALFGDDLSRLSRFRANRAMMSASPFRGDPDINSVQSYVEDLEMLYDSTIRQVDSAVDKLVDTILEQSKNTSIIFTADHGEEFLEHGSVQHGSQLYGELLHVPLIIYNEHTPAREIEKPVQLMDLPPTIAEITGAPNHEKYQGYSLASILREGEEPEDRAIISALKGNNSISVRNSRYTYITHKGKRSDEFYDRQIDPVEQHLTMELSESIRDQFESTIAAYRRLTEPPILTSESVEPSEEIQSRLNDLGYT